MALHQRSPHTIINLGSTHPFPTFCIAHTNTPWLPQMHILSCLQKLHNTALNLSYFHLDHLRNLLAKQAEDAAKGPMKYKPRAQ